MARPPKPPGLHVVDGTYRNDRHADRLAHEIEQQGRPVPPARLTKVQRKHWDRIVDMCWWLSESDSYALYGYVRLFSMLERSPDKMNSAKLSSWIALGGKLGLDSVGRARYGSAKAQAETESPGAKFFKRG